MNAERRAALTDAVGLSAILLLLFDYLRPELVLLPTILAGGDTPCHFPAAEWFSTRLLPELRLHGWYPGAYLGHPLLLYYFPVPFVLMAALRPLYGPEVAFKLGVALGIPALPLLAYLGFRRLGFRFPGPLLGAAAALVFLFLEKNPIWGGTIASTMTGEFAYTYGTGLAVLFLGVVYRAYTRGTSKLLPAALLALTALTHGYAVLWAGLSATYFLYVSRRPAKTLVWLVATALLAFALAGVHMVPLLYAWGMTTPYDDPWIDAGIVDVAPAYLLPMFALAALGLLANLGLARFAAGPDHRFLFLMHAGVMAAALAAAGPGLGLIDVRFVPFAQLALCLAAAAALARFIELLAAPGLVALGLVLAAGLYADRSSTLSRAWIEYNFTGLQAKELWPAWSRLTRVVAGGVAEPRVAVEYSAEHEKAGSIRMYETLPYFSGRSTLEGVYNQASLQTHFVYYLASELGEASPNPFKKREYSGFDTDNAVRHLRLLGANEVVAVSAKLKEALASRPDIDEVPAPAPYALFRLRQPVRYVEPLAFEPVRSSPAGWRDKAYRWFSRKPQSDVHLVFTGDPRFRVAERDEWLPPPAVPLEGGVEVEADVRPEEMRIRTSRPGHPLLVKVSYHPRWRAEGADGPYLASPALMLIVPRQPEVRLTYASDASDRAGLALTLLGVLAGLISRRVAVSRRSTPAPASRQALLEECGQAPPIPRRWGAVVPLGLLAVLLGLRLITVLPEDHASLGRELYERGSRAYAEGRFGDAAEYVRHALPRSTDPGMRPELLCLRGESLLRAGAYRDAVAAFEQALEESAHGPYTPQALFGLAQALDAAGESERARTTRDRLRQEHPRTPWTARLEHEA
ncbi:MAG TPA: 6-pyruvoyl-tetrahydropterin synthase-related protein [Vicinamibacteria bacterium]|nr:6-pyruvoyl-tetrahydropterin synthase-related protein [Vicinamibacteria bacterium]